MVVEPRLKNLHRGGFVLVLGSLVLALHDDVGGQVRDAHRGVGSVDVLAARPPGTIGVDPQILGANVHLDFVVDLGVDEHRPERCVAPGIRVERGNPDKPVNPDFRPQQPVNILAGDGKGR